ncbi:MAG: hypothetical protein A3B75_00490 [Candidatus Terrybacteria bacterium RIFCSPHIGHO2_02_FULL_43_14]|nr:MAG: hypothetical protein A3B75_00490 [Candidatus Terrybacteria bacterium RIFCSPHIGHO2_02_FULL_43_14]
MPEIGFKERVIIISKEGKDMEGDKKSTGTVYNFCESCDACPVSEEALIENNSGLILRDDFGGEVKLTDNQLKDFAAFLVKRFK